MSRDGRLIMRERFGAQAGVMQREPELQVAHREVRPEREGRAVTGDRGEIFALTEQGVAQVIARRRAAGATGRTFGQQLFGACVVAAVDEARAEVVVVMAGAGIPGEGLFHQADAFVGTAQVEEGQAMQVTDVVAVGDEFQQPLVDPGGVGEATRLMEFHRMVEG